MKKYIMMVFLGLGMTVFAQEIVTATGKVTKSRSGQNDSTFYTFQLSDSDKSYQANTKAPDVKKYEELFKESLNSGRELSIEFDTNPQFPSGIRRIKKIELK